MNKGSHEPNSRSLRLLTLLTNLAPSVRQCDDFVRAGAEHGLTPRDVVRAADVTFCCVSGPRVVKDVSAVTVFDGFHVSSMNSFVVFFFSCCGVLWLCVLGVTILRKSGYLQSIFTGRI